MQAERRWTCDACGCHTNQAEDQSCSICGTARGSASGVGALYRRSGYAAAAARAGWLAREPADADELWGEWEDSSSVMDSLAAEVSGMAEASAAARSRLEVRQRFLQAQRALSSSSAAASSSMARAPAELLAAATLRADDYQPQWADPQQLLTLSGRATPGQNDLQLGEGERGAQVAHVPVTAGEGRAIRASVAVPRLDGPSGLASFLAPASEPRPMSFGFRVAFDRPNLAPGASLGGGYLIGVTTSSFTAYGDHHALLQTPFFYGVDDAARKYEGAQRRSTARLSRRTTATSSPFAIDLTEDEAPLNANGTLFGCRQVVTVVVDLESRSLTFWRDETLLGTLVTGLPRSSTLFPTAVPVHRGATVAVTGLNGDPLPLLERFSAEWQQVQRQKEQAIRQRLRQERLVLMAGGQLTEELRDVVRTIFAAYSDGASRLLEASTATRLWYRCGLKLSALQDLLTDNVLELNAFLGVLERVAAEDEESWAATAAGTGDKTCRVGDKVELVDGYDKFGDASGGPLQPGDRGVVVEVQSGPNGESGSVRVLYNGRRWWYQPQAIVSERSGMIESPGVWFLRSVLRVHGYDHASLSPLAAVDVTCTNVRVGDMVKPKNDRRSAARSPACFGRVVSESATSGSLASRARESGNMVSVEFVDPSFASATGIKLTSSSESSPSLEVRRVRASKLAFCTLEETVGPKDTTSTAARLSDAQSDDTEASGGPVSERLRTEMAALARLERSAIEFMTRECKRSSGSLAGLFSAGLPDAVISAIDVAERQMNSLEPREDLPEKISLIGKLSMVIASQLFESTEMPDDIPDEDMAAASADEGGERSRSAAEARRLRLREAMARGGDEDGDSGSRNLAVLQQRRSMLLSLMSRARRGNSRYLNELIERENEFFGGDMPGVPLPLRAMNDLVQPFAFGGSAGLLQDGNWEDGNAFDVERSNGSADELDAGQPQREMNDAEESFLDSILRCRGDKLSSVTLVRSAGSTQTLFGRQLACFGVLGGNLAWVRASIDSQAKKVQLTSAQKSASILRDLKDDEGTPILMLALSLGCHSSVLSYLISRGAPVTKAEICKAAVTDQPDSLALMLEHNTHTEELVLSDFSPAVQAVFAKAKARQGELDRKMREDAGAFMTRLLRRLLRFALASRRRRSTRVELCSRTIADILVGNSLLRSLQRTQKSARTADEAAARDENDDEDDEEEDDEDDDDEDGADLANRFTMEEEESGQGSCNHGVLGALPRTSLVESLLSDIEHLTSFLSLIEAYLCSKDMGDGAAGLALLHVLLTKFPELRASSEMKRYGMAKLVSFHDALASTRIEEIVSNQPKRGDATAVSPPGLAGRASEDHVVMCPNKHTALIHITRHSSFRCDICGNGVERGRPMHGCRECDWDACEDCTDKSESGLVKCQSIKDLAEKCLNLLLEEPNSKDESLHPRVTLLETFARDESATKLAVLAVRLMRRDVCALAELGDLLLKPGHVTIHQFLNHMLPTLHAAFVGRPPESEGAVLHHSARKTKKARVLDDGEDSALESPDERLNFCKHAVRLLFSGEDEHVGLSEALARGRSLVGNLGGEQEGSSEASPPSHLVKCSDAAQELVRRLHQILTLHERVDTFSCAELGLESSDKKGGDLQSLTKPIKLRLSASKFSGSVAAGDLSLVLEAEPLLSMADLRLHVLRTSKVDDPAYLEFCKNLAEDEALIVERAPRTATGHWRLAKVVEFDEETGAHTLLYGVTSREVLCLDRNSDDLFRHVSFKAGGEKVKVALVSRDYVILQRSVRLEASAAEFPTLMDCEPSPSRPRRADSPSSLREFLGSRVESNCGTSGWRVHTLVALGQDGATLVSDEGLVYSNIQPDQIRVKKKSTNVGQEPERDVEARLPAWARDDPAMFNRAFPFIAARRALRSDDDGPAASQSESTMKRNWSALALVDSMRPIDLKVDVDTVSSQPDSDVSNETMHFKLADGRLECSTSLVEVPPRILVKFSLSDKLAGIDLGDLSDITLVGAFKMLHGSQDKNIKANGDDVAELYFSLEPDVKFTGKKCDLARMPSHSDDEAAQVERRLSLLSPSSPSSRCRKFSSRSLTSSFDDDSASVICEGLDDVCLQCMEIVGLLSEYAFDGPIQMERDVPVETILANYSLSKKLSDQLEDPLAVVGRALPHWCMSAPTYAPRVFSYESRRMLLERVAFGVSRSTLKQQESKVNVGRLRQRMASLRARAVELVGEAFSGGAEDPTALQLQADELYGMEEALAARVRAAFRAVKWQEHVLEVAKAVVRRENLLEDATSVMEQYANDKNVFRRRLEVRFQGESGFDAASGNEAGVTRGFYADVAEALLSSDTVAGVHCASNCSSVPLAASLKLQPMDVDGLESDLSKLPLWIPDMDASGQVVIPTPRADERSGPGVFPRPLPSYHPQMAEVLQRFRFMGRLFAAAMRDGFMFPLPLSSSFLNLVQHGGASAVSTDAKAQVSDSILTAADLPRPGFLGGEIYAADTYICKALDLIDASDPPLSGLELERRYKEVAEDPKFARIALGKSFDYSFEDYFQERTFVDPLDPTQGEDAVPLCRKGHRKHVTIVNVREWVALAKNFVLSEGVVPQAKAFRQGVDDFFSADYLRLFTPEELQRDVCGVGDSVDHWDKDEAAVRKLFKLDGGRGAAEALVAVAAIGGEGGAALSRRFGPSSPTIGFLVKALVEGTPKQRRQFLSFVTSVPIVTPGRIDVVPIVSPSGEFLPMQDPSCLPRANTCARRLYLPKFESYETFCQVLWAVVAEESKFKGFFEWRGN